MFKETTKSRLIIKRLIIFVLIIGTAFSTIPGLGNFSTLGATEVYADDMQSSKLTFRENQIDGDKEHAITWSGTSTDIPLSYFNVTVNDEDNVLGSYGWRDGITVLPALGEADFVFTVNPDLPVGEYIAYIEFDVNGKNIKSNKTIYEINVIVKHNIYKHLSLDPTCYSDGNIEYYKCHDCDIFFADEDGKVEIEESDTVIPKLGHVYPASGFENYNSGYHKNTCSRCGAAQYEQHSWDGGTVTRDATTEATGIRTYTCTACDATKTEVIPKKSSDGGNDNPGDNTGGGENNNPGEGGETNPTEPPAHNHSWKLSKTVAATCTKDGSKTYTCSCGETKIETIPATGHNYNNKKTVQSSCTKEGTITETCGNCGNVKTTAIAKKAHSLTKVAEKPATCLQSGVKAYWYCSTCGTRFSDAAGTKETTAEALIINPKGHSYGNWTKLSDTQHQRVCANDKTHIQKANHTWKKDEKKSVDATCTKAGKNVYNCADCGATKTETVAARGHLYNTHTQLPACFTEGLRTETCSRCGDVKETVLAKTAHTLSKVNEVPATCTVSGTKAYWKCQTCGARFSDSNGKNELTATDILIMPKGHTWDSGKVTKAATATSTGIMTYTCTKCNATRTSTIEMTPSVPSTAGTTIRSHRLSGSNKFNTAYTVSKHLLDKNGKFKNIIVVNRDKPADAISSGYLSKAKGGAPVLLWNSKQTQTIISYAKNNMAKGGTVYLVGGTSAISKAAEKSIKDAGIKCIRLSGKTKYDTNLAVLKDTFKKGNDLMVISNSSRMDGVPANAVGKPLMMVAKDGLSAEQQSWLKSAGVRNIYLVGTTSAFSSKVESQLKTYGTLKKITGKNSIDVSINVANQFFKTSKNAVVVKNYADGLVSPPLAQTYKAPILLITNKNYSGAKNYIKDKGVTNLYVIGGESAVEKATLTKLVS